MDKKSSERRITRAQSKSPGRTKKPSRPKSKSPGRKSPVKRSPGRPKNSPKTVKETSPGRKASPKRKVSPVRTISPVRKISPARRFTPTISTESIYKDRESRSSPFVRLERREEIKLLPKSVETLRNEVEIARDRSVSLPKASTSAQISSRIHSEETTLIRRSSRLRRDEQLEEITNVMNVEVDKILKANNVPLPPQYERKYGEKPVREFGSWLGALAIILLLPAFVLALQMSCTKSKCSGLVTPSANWKVYLDLHTAGYYLVYLVWQTLLSSLPFSRKVSYGQLQARPSGFYNALLTFSALGVLYYYGFNITSVLGKSVALLSSAILTALLLAIGLFVKGGRTLAGHNLNADGNKLYDFFIGRQIFPTVGPLNIKALLSRMEFVGILVLDTLYLLKFIETHAAGVYSPTLLFIVFTHTVYVFDTLWFEEKFMTSFEAQYEGVGYMSAMAAATWPFLLTLATRYIVYTSYEADAYLLVVCGVLFFCGYFLYRASNSQKAEFRKNPQHPVFAKYDTVSTFLGKRLLCGGWWGYIRHPNYLGDMLMMWSMAAPCGLSHWLPYVFPLLHSAVLIHRTFRVSTRCRSLYGAAWDRYTQLVKYRLVPRVF